MMVGLRIAERRALETTPNPETAWVESDKRGDDQNNRMEPGMLWCVWMLLSSKVELVAA
jgi:hypothetical protein